MAPITIVDYGAGNLSSVARGFEAVGASVRIATRFEQLAGATAIVIPGVGHFAATAALDDVWRAAILDHVRSGRPLLGICLGMQWLFEGSDEADCPGLGVLAGRCTRLDSQTGTLKVPHVGWNSMDFQRAAPIVDGVARGTQVYFTHSYAPPVTGDTVAVTEHGQPFASIVQRGQVAGVQFHPEKSGEAGLRILRNFLEVAR